MPSALTAASTHAWDPPYFCPVSHNAEGCRDFPERVQETKPLLIPAGKARQWGTPACRLLVPRSFLRRSPLLSAERVVLALTSF